MEILEAATPSAIRINLDFFKPFEAHSTTDFRLEEMNGATQVSWAMHGEAPFMFKLMHLFFNMDKMVGKDFEADLAKLKEIAEKSGATVTSEPVSSPSKTRS